MFSFCTISFFVAHVGGIPQNRALLYIVGTPSNASDMIWPEPIATKNVKKLLDKPQKGQESWYPKSATMLGNLMRLLGKMETQGDDPSDTYFMDICQSAKMGDKIKLNCSPTLTRTRAMAGGYYVSSHSRMLKTTEMLRLQGFPEKRINFKDVKYTSASGKKLTVSERALRGMVGNAMSVSVVGRIMWAALQACELISGDVPDPWA